MGSPGKAADLQRLLEKVRAATMQARYEEFALQLQHLSRDFRSCVGGDVSDDDVAAYDPIFWLHHTNLDRIWAHWQVVHSAVSMPDFILSATLEPFAASVRDVLQMDKLAYSYDDLPIFKTQP